MDRKKWIQTSEGKLIRWSCIDEISMCLGETGEIQSIRLYARSIGEVSENVFEFFFSDLEIVRSEHFENFEKKICLNFFKFIESQEERLILNSEILNHFKVISEEILNNFKEEFMGLQKAETH